MTRIGENGKGFGTPNPYGVGGSAHVGVVGWEDVAADAVDGAGRNHLVVTLGMRLELVVHHFLRCCSIRSRIKCPVRRSIEVVTIIVGSNVICIGSVV